MNTILTGPELIESWGEDEDGVIFQHPDIAERASEFAKAMERWGCTLDPKIHGTGTSVDVFYESDKVSLLCTVYAAPRKISFYGDDYQTPERPTGACEVRGTIPFPSNQEWLAQWVAAMCEK